MTEWTMKATADKTYANAVTFFNDKMVGIEAYKAAKGNTSGQNSFNKANAVTDIVSQVVKSLQSFKVENKEAFEKRSTAIAMVVGNFKSGLSEVHSKMNEIELQLATILAALSGGLRNLTRVIEESDDASDSDNDTPVKPPPCKAKKQKRKPMVNPTTFSKGDKFTIGISFDQNWDLSTREAYNSAKAVYAKANPVFAKQEREKKQKLLKRQLAKLGEE